MGGSYFVNVCFVAAAEPYPAMYVGVWPRHPFASGGTAWEGELGQNLFPHGNRDAALQPKELKALHLV